MERKRERERVGIMKEEKSKMIPVSVAQFVENTHLLHRS